MRTLIGRDHAAAALRAEIARTADSHGGLVLVTGEAGIGKTALVTSAAEEARRVGALVLTGACWDSDSAPGYWPWVQVIRDLRRRAPTEDTADRRLSILLGESANAEGGDSFQDSFQDGFQLYDAVTSALVGAADQRPVVVVLDDLHWADIASLQLLEFAARHTWFERLLLVGTYRDDEVAAPEHPLRQVFRPLLSRATVLALAGLDRGEVGRLMAETVDQVPEDELVVDVHRRTGGNPFFVEQTALLWRSQGSVTATAPGVRDALRRRLSLLPERVERLLTSAAVLGREFHRHVLAGAVAVPVPEVDRLLDQAAAVRLVAALGGGRFAFTHDLVRETLYDALDAAAARAQHAAVVRALTGSPATGQPVLPAELARHAYLAGAELEPANVVDYLQAAARDASRRLAIQEEIGHLRRALEVAERPDQRALVSLDLGGVLHHWTGRDQGWPLLIDAATIARGLDDPELLARVALTVGQVGTPTEQEQLKADLLREAHRRLAGDGQVGPSPDADLEGVTTDLVAHLIMRARQGSDDEALGFSLWAQHDALWGPGTAAERDRLTQELVEVARRTSDHEMEQFATSFRWVALLEQGDPRYLDQLHTLVALVRRDEQPRMRIGVLMDRCIIATFRGEFELARELFEQAVTFPEEHDHNAFRFMTDQLRWAFLMQQGRFDEVDGLLPELGKRGYPYPGLIEALTALQRGDLTAALRYRGEEPYPRYFLPLWLRFQAQLAAAVRDPELCERARAALRPYAGQWLVALYGAEISGPATLWLAGLDAAQERWDEAIEGFTVARQSADLLQARPWSILARAGLAEVLLARDSAGDRADGTALLDSLEPEASELGMRQVLDRVRRIRSTLDAMPGAGSGAGAGAGAANEFRIDGEVWTLTMAGRTVHLPDAKGLHDLRLLLSLPGTEVLAVRLLDPAGGEAVVAARRLSGDDLLDEQAKAQYKRRLSQLDEEIDQAASRGDDDRAAELDQERAALLAELRAAAGLGGRTRRLGDEAERARKTVTARIRDTLRKLDQRHPELAAHLRATVSTGTTCRYEPDPTISWRL